MDTNEKEADLTERVLNYSSAELGESLKVGAEALPRTNWYLVEARCPNSGEAINGKAKVRESKGGNGGDVLNGDEQREELVGRASSWSNAIARRRAIEKLYQRTLPNHRELIHS